MKQLNDQYFNYRQTPVGYDGVAKPSIKGNTLVWNQLVQNGNFASTTGWVGGSNNTNSVSNNVLTATPIDLSVSGNRYVRRSETYNLPSGHKLFISLKASSTSGSFNLQYVKQSPWTVVRNKLISVSTSSFTQYMDVYELSNDVNIVIFNFDGKNDLKLSNVWMVDLTQMFGSGNEPSTVDEFTSLFPLSYYAYDSGSLLNFNGSGIKTVGFNQWDEEWEVGQYSTVNGSKTSASNTIRCKNAIEVISNTTYYCNTSGKNMRVLYYDSYSNFISIEPDLVVNRAITTPLNAGFICFYMGSAYGTTYNDDVCINISDTSKNGTYEPYITSTTSLPISTYFPTGMKSAGSVYDELSDKAITRVGTATISGGITSKDSQNKLFLLPTISGIKGGLGYTDVPNITSRFEATNLTSARESTMNAICQNLSSVYISLAGQNITTIADANTYLASNPITINYELATYTEQDINADLFYKFYGNGTEQLLPVNTDTPSTSPLLADIIYYNLTDSEVPYRVFWMINSKGERWDFTEREFKSFLNNPQGLGFSKTFSVNRYGNVQNLTDITDNFPQPNGEVLFYDSSNSTRYDKYNNFVKFLSYEPITLYYKIPVSFFSRIPNTYSLECVVGTLSKTESKTDHMLTCSINYNALSFYKGEEVEISGTGLTYTINNDGDFPVGFEIEINATYNFYMKNPYIQLSQDGSLYGEAKFIDDTRFNKVYINSNDGEQSVVLEQGGSILPNPMSYQDLSISNGNIYVTFVKLARGETTLTIGADSEDITDVTIRYTPIYRSV